MANVCTIIFERWRNRWYSVDKHTKSHVLCSVSFIHHNWWGPPDQPYDWGRYPRVHRWLMRPICVWKSLRQWEQGLVVAVADVAVPFLSFLCSSVATFLLVSQTFVPCLTTLHHLSMSCASWITIRGDTERSHGDLQCVFESIFLVCLGVLALR